MVDTNKEEIYVNSSDNALIGEAFTGMDFMAVSDYVVTDYSSIIYEALLKNLPIYIFCFDSDKYLDERGFYIDFWNDLPAAYAKDAKGIVAEVLNESAVSAEKTEQFKKAYVNKKYPSVTKEYGRLIDELVKGEYDGRYNYRKKNNE